MCPREDQQSVGVRMSRRCGASSVRGTALWVWLYVKFGLTEMAALVDRQYGRDERDGDEGRARQAPGSHAPKVPVGSAGGQHEPGL